MEDQWKAVHPFQPNLINTRRASSIVNDAKEREYNKRSGNDMHLQRYLKNNFDEKTGQPLYKPAVNPFKPQVIKKAYKARYNQEVADQAKEVDKRIAAVFRFFTLGSDVLKIQDLDCINLKNECIVLLKNVIINIIKSDNHLTYTNFVDLVLSENLLPDIERTYAFIEGRSITPEKHKANRKKDPVASYTSNYDTEIHKLMAGHDHKANNGDDEVKVKHSKYKMTKNYAKLT